MEKRFTEKNGEIVLDHASANDGDWAEVVPETVRVLREYLETDRYAVLTGQEHTEPLGPSRSWACPTVACPR